MKNISNVLLAIVLLSVTVSCRKDDDDSELQALENRLFEAYLETNNINVEPTESGLYFYEKEQGTGLSPIDGNWVIIKYELMLIDGEQVIYTHDQERAENLDIFDERLIYGNTKLQLGMNISGFDEGLKMMKEGGEADLIFKSNLGYGKQGAGIIGPYKSLVMNIQLEKVIGNPIAWESDQIKDYVSSNNISNIDTTESGLYFIQIEEGTGDSVVNNAYVSVNVDGFLIDGRQFLGEDLFRFQLGAYDYAVTEGLNEGISMMKESGKAKLIVPYYLGYGVNGKSYYEGKAKVPIPPYTTLVYDIELLSSK